tara:strand:+ start:539 stop:1549 length:1011 start_codon:yes stop_codon:yes gene_type:complete
MAQDPDFQIPNGTGQAVRQDIETAILALASLSSGAQSGLGTTQPCQLFADTTNNLLKIRDTGGNAAANLATFHTIGQLNTANLGLFPVTGGSLTGVLTLVTGSASGPSVNFGDSTTGFFKSASNIVGFSGAGTESFKFSSNGIDFLGTKPARFYDSDSSHFVGLKSPSVVSSNKTYTLPATSAANNILTVDGSNNMSFTASPTLTSVKSASYRDENNSNASTAQEIAQGRAKAWVRFNGTGTPSISDSFNIDDITDEGSGIYDCEFTSAMNNSNYAVVISARAETSAYGQSAVCQLHQNSTPSVSEFRICRSYQDDNNNAVHYQDSTMMMVAVFGD